MTESMPVQNTVNISCVRSFTWEGTSLSYVVVANTLLFLCDQTASDIFVAKRSTITMYFHTKINVPANCFD